MSWGYKILGVYLVFVTGIVFLVIKSSNQKVDLVTKDYYEQELMYQDKINETARASKLTGAITCEVKGQQILVKLPAEMSGQDVSADVLLYCPSDSRKDVSRQIQTNNGQLLMDFPAGYKGQFEVKVNWKAGGQAYYTTQKLFIQ